MTPVKPARAPFDWYVEPAWSVEKLFDIVPMLGSVGDPACGLGTIPEVARARGHETVACDIVDRGYRPMAPPADFLADASAFAGVDNIVCNPPYSYIRGISDAFARRAIGLARNTVAMLVPVNWLATEARFRLFTEHEPSQVIVLTRRPSMPPGTEIAALGVQAFKRGKVSYCWVVWERGEHHSTEVAGDRVLNLRLAGAGR